MEQNKGISIEKPHLPEYKDGDEQSKDRNNTAEHYKLPGKLFIRAGLLCHDITGHRNRCLVSQQRCQQIRITIPHCSYNRNKDEGSITILTTTTPPAIFRFPFTLEKSKSPPSIKNAIGVASFARSLSVVSAALGSLTPKRDAMIPRTEAMISGFFSIPAMTFLKSRSLFPPKKDRAITAKKLYIGTKTALKIAAVTVLAGPYIFSTTATPNIT